MRERERKGERENYITYLEENVEGGEVLESHVVIVGQVAGGLTERTHGLHR